MSRMETGSVELICETGKPAGTICHSRFPIPTSMTITPAGRSFHVNCVSRVNPANTLKKQKNKVFCIAFVVQWYSIHWHTVEPIR
jgi:hypothetical protein